MAKKFTLGSFLNAVAKSADRSLKASAKKRQRELAQAQKQYIVNQKKLEKERKIIEMTSKGYVQVSVKSLEKYIKGAIIAPQLLAEMNSAIMRGESKIFVYKFDLNDMEDKLRKHKEKERILNQCASFNNKGISYENEGKINLAIKAYEKNIQSDYPAHHSFKRLMILYREKKDYNNERRVILKTLEVFPNYEEYIDRLNKVEQLINKNL
jgi:tetratricopeptide (TPR) repeat protein